MGKIVWGLILFLCVLACVDPYDIKSAATPGLLVVEGVVSDQYKKHQIFLTRATAVGDRKTIREGGAEVSLSDDQGNVITLEEAAPGVYETPEFAASTGRTYTLHIRTSDNEEFQSTQIPFKSGPGIKNLYAKYIDDGTVEGTGIQVYVDTEEDPDAQSRYYRWSFIETYEVHAPFPSNWIYVGNNNVEFRHDGIDTCYATDTLRSILIKSTQNLEEDQVIGQTIRFIPAYSHLLRYKFSVLLQQFTLSEEAYLYWENVKTISEAQGTLSDVQPGSVPGNIVSLTNPDRPALGFFEVCTVAEQRLTFTPLDFYNDGLVRPQEFRAYCYEIAPVLVHQLDLDRFMPRYGDTMYIWEVFGFVPFTAQLMPKSCCDCRDQGPTERPPFF